MKHLFVLVAFLAVSMPAMAAAPAGRGRASMSKQMESRAAAVKETPQVVVTQEETQTEDVEIESNVVKDMREREKVACTQNNIGVGNTFVWASRYSDTSSYNMMIEDVENPDNNVCFVKVAMKSDDTRVDVSDIPTKYFAMGDTITCGQWVDKEVLRQRILDAKKKGRTWATVGGAVGGAAIGVGAMELFGNKLIGSTVEGQTKTEAYCLHWKNLEESKKQEAKALLETLQSNCNSLGDNKPTDCDKYKYGELLNCINS